ncbi:MAG: SRPBCC family protein [Gammaproteobacteria bacterium]|nr:SRPBCC family protein [Gammaproteobacteria bacterium]
MATDLYIDINKPIDQVIELFDSFENLKQWQPELVSYEHLSGVSGQPGAKTQLVYKMGKRECPMIETVLERDLPEKFSGTYETPGMTNHIENRFEALDDNKTRWHSRVDYQMTSIPMKILGFFMKKSFYKQSYIFMERFRDFAEGQ